MRSNICPALKQMENVIAKAIMADMTGAVFGTATSYYKTNMKGYYLLPSLQRYPSLTN
jgi:hypothetical protein